MAQDHQQLMADLGTGIITEDHSHLFLPPNLKDKTSPTGEWDKYMDWNGLSGHKKYPIDIEEVKRRAFAENPQILNAT